MKRRKSTTEMKREQQSIFKDKMMLKCVSLSLLLMVCVMYCPCKYSSKEIFFTTYIFTIVFDPFCQIIGIPSMVLHTKHLEVIPMN